MEVEAKVYGVKYRMVMDDNGDLFVKFANKGAWSFYHRDHSSHNYWRNIYLYESYIP